MDHNRKNQENVKMTKYNELWINQLRKGLLITNLIQNDKTDDKTDIT